MSEHAGHMDTFMDNNGQTGLDTSLDRSLDTSGDFESKKASIDQSSPEELTIEGQMDTTNLIRTELRKIATGHGYSTDLSLKVIAAALLQVLDGLDIRRQKGK